MPELIFISDVEHTHVRYLGNLVLHLWDCGAQSQYFESHLQRDVMFRGVEILIYVFDITTMDETSIAQYDEVLLGVEENSPNATIFVLFHKMDLLDAEDRFRVFAEKQAAIKESSLQ